MAFRKCAELKEVTLQYQSNGPATIQLYTDMPGGALAARGPAVSLPNTAAGRKTITVPLDTFEATEFYFAIVPGNATQLRLFSGVVYVRPIGVYIDGSVGEIWSTPPLSIGT